MRAICAQPGAAVDTAGTAEVLVLRPQAEPPDVPEAA